MQICHINRSLNLNAQLKVSFEFPKEEHHYVLLFMVHIWRFLYSLSFGGPCRILFKIEANNVGIDNGATVEMISNLDTTCNK